MQRIYTIDTTKKIEKKVLLKGWIQNVRNIGKLIFVSLRDGSGTVQVIVNEQVQKGIDVLKSEYAVEIIGTVKQRPASQGRATVTGMIEIVAEKIRIISRAKELPFDVEAKANIEAYLDYQPFTLRSERSRAIFRFQSEIVNAFRSFLRKQRFVEFQAPNFVPSATEGGANVFPVKYFDHTAYLSQSPQFYKQIMVGIFERVYTITKAFRAEEHATSRHLNEYSTLDFEMGFIRNHTDVMAMENRLLSYMMQFLEKTCAHELQLLGARLPQVPKKIPSLKLRQAQKIIQQEFGEDCTQEPDLSPQHERWICDYAAKQYNSEFIFITHYPTKKRPMYTFPDPKNPDYTYSFDLLFRGLEITTGGQRIHDYDQLLANIKAWGNNPKYFSFYLQAFQYGMPPEGGLAIGLERLTAQLLGLENVKEATLFPRDQNRIDVLLSKLHS
ncbi:MAG: aspartate--tRNA(Asn) ligase [Candidatus Kerfeldbacteria bacterium RIFCSPHIGHO2_02_FULL_42_14]|uniref:Aspartate--tRNA ligase n=1 Tax=Candidatus Kerfeldbacteria bacterium RIFCSPHIGHO2_02_FULL_42_14 TaxID=1798540 RepID=A0A1G2ASX2_9BACT|nr:MAG: aspartate--tRNA(Asn) ligase [Candidatus Kerfeldbacteria bacterium RIFCSPHIGHO2_02_FULL_42_14]OGY80390.1 MAG: aspartate--tRNA(Asn) ligase [Candidatus Kerfeldbacteria bacterium RIFCSPHIGHO2_12_FULL_42_13]OGY83819.1 MAG: aspartate--tRNA(Asn) ligase [Candidatus Kerfeldbacteria bacterium RIFCSPLOWO2_02_FULL_42_19]OGY85407.1 MAG: aspartate--tRNA(Asn) ligase [Candidatus Kerfeldbacteria bacterium RIFCSPLOWO2_12_FULL_43_9]